MADLALLVPMVVSVVWTHNLRRVYLFIIFQIMPKTSKDTNNGYVLSGGTYRNSSHRRIRLYVLFTSKTAATLFPGMQPFNLESEQSWKMMLCQALMQQMKLLKQIQQHWWENEDRYANFANYCLIPEMCIFVIYLTLTTNEALFCS